MKNHRFLNSRWAGTVLAVLLVAICVCATFMILMSTSVGAAGLLITIPLCAIAFAYLRASERKRKAIDAQFQQAGELEGCLGVLLLLVIAGALFIAAILGWKLPGEIFVRIVRSITGSE